jgi:hypothetical protein
MVEICRPPRSILEKNVLILQGGGKNVAWGIGGPFDRFLISAEIARNATTLRQEWKHSRPDCGQSGTGVALQGPTIPFGRREQGRSPGEERPRFIAARAAPAL